MKNTYIFILLHYTSITLGAASSGQALHKIALNPTYELEKIALQNKIYPYQFARIGRLLKEGADPLSPSEYSKKSACSMFFENNTLWCLLGTFSEHLPAKLTLPETMATACAIILAECAEDELEQQTTLNFLTRFKTMIKWGLHANPDKIHLNRDPLISLTCFLCEYKEGAIKKELISFMQILEEQQFELEQDQNTSSEEDDATEEQGLQEERGISFIPSSAPFPDEPLEINI